VCCSWLKILIDIIYDTLTNEITRQALYVYRNNEACSCRNYYTVKAISTTYSQCAFVALLTQHAKRMRHIDTCGITFLPSHKRHDFRGEKSYWTWNVFWLFFLKVLPETFFIPRRTERDMSKNVHMSSCQVLRYSWQMIIKPEFSRQIFENTQYQTS
jgi:hypothetical protein